MKTHSIVKKYTRDFLNTEIKEYAIYVIKSRAMPSIMDGMRIGARKILWAAMTGDLKRGHKDKMPSLIGDTMKLKFHHGDASLKNTIEQLGSQHVFKYAPLDVIGQYPSLRNPETSTAARYLEVKINQFINWFKMDMDLLDQLVEEGKKIEPNFFTPIVPIVLLYRTNSPGFGFGYRSFSFRLDDVIDATMQAVITGTCTGLTHVRLKPEIVGIEPKNIIYNESKNFWYNVGEYEVYDNDILRITDLPYNVTINKYRLHLDSLVESGYILRYREDGEQNTIDFKIKFNTGRLKILMNEKFKFFSKFKLYTKIPDLNLNCIDTDSNSIISFDTPNDLVDGFVKRRLTIYNKRKINLIHVIEEKIIDLTDKAKFIQLVVDEKLVLYKRKIADIKLDCDKFGVTYNGLELKAVKFTQEEIDKHLAEIEELKAELDYINNTTIQQMYIKDLIDFKAKYSTILKPGETMPEVTYRDEVISL